jgi:hypothetical protein
MRAGGGLSGERTKPPDPDRTHEQSPDLRVFVLIADTPGDGLETLLEGFGPGQGPLLTGRFQCEINE